MCKGEARPEAGRPGARDTLLDELAGRIFGGFLTMVAGIASLFRRSISYVRTFDDTLAA
jgi:hypothetical protein